MAAKGLKVPKSTQKQIAKNVKRQADADLLIRKSKDTKIPTGAMVDMAPEPDAGHKSLMPGSIVTAPEPQQLTLPLLTDSATLFIQGAQQLTAQLLGTPECAPLLVRVNEWLKRIGEIKKLITGDEDKIEGLKKLVIDQGEPWGERGSKQMVLAGAIVKVKAVNWREVGSAPAVSDLDPAKVESYLRQNVDPTKENVEKVLGSFMKATISWSLTDLSPTQQANLAKMLADPGEWGQGLRECVKEIKYQMMAPTMGEES